MTDLSSELATRRAAGAYVIRVTIANAFLLFPLIVMAAEAIWGQRYGAFSFKLFVYALTFSIIPLAGLGGSWLSQQCNSRGGATELLDVALTGPGMIAALAYLSTSHAWDNIELIARLTSAAVLVGVALAFLLPLSWKNWCERACRPLAAAIWLASPLIFPAVALWSVAGWLGEHAISDGAFQLGSAGGALCVVAIYAGPQLLASRSARARTGGRLLLAACAIGAGIVILRVALHVGYSCTPSFWPRTYSEWVGPANAVLAGGVPMVDAISLYGVLDYLVYAAAFKFIVPPSFFAADAVTVALNALAVVLAIVICLKAARNRFLVLIVIAAIVPALPWIWIAHPAGSAARFAAPMLLLLALAWLRPGRTLSWATIAAMVVCGLWSWEVLLWATLAYTAFLGAVCVERRGGVLRNWAVSR